MLTVLVETNFKEFIEAIKTRTSLNKWCSSVREKEVKIEENFLPIISLFKEPLSMLSMQEKLEPFEIHLHVNVPEKANNAKVFPKGDGLYAVFLANDLLSVPHRSREGWKDLKEGEKTPDFGSIVELIERHYSDNS